jgi:hypothetical protein
MSGAVAGLTASFGILLDQDEIAGLDAYKWAVPESSVALLLAGILYFATMYAYDSLLMPQRFWGERRPQKSRSSQASGNQPSKSMEATPLGSGRGWLVARPPSSAAWILYQNMMRIWRNLSTVASLLVGVGIALLGYGALQLDPTIANIGGVALLTITVSGFGGVDLSWAVRTKAVGYVW